MVTNFCSLVNKGCNKVLVNNVIQVTALKTSKVSMDIAETGITQGSF